MTASIPLLLPPTAIPRPASWEHEWTPKKYLSGPQPPPVDDARVLEQEMATARQLADGKAVKKTRPRRTVDYNGRMGRWALAIRGLTFSPNDGRFATASDDSTIRI
ncbi:hypothetical protein EDD16DRAFT_1563645, partial [Pisolithus croceorrhizus]